MSQETKTRKKYAPLRISRRLPGERDREASALDFLEVVPETTPEEKKATQECRQAILAGLLARAEVLVPDSPDSPTRKACRASPIDEIVVEKFRQQGFSL